jgi:hypothetical protein
MTTREKTSFWPPIFTIAICLLVLAFSINQIINLASPSKKTIEASKVFTKQYNLASSITTLPNQNYETVTNALHAKFPDEPDIATRLGITPEIAQLPTNEQIFAIRQNILESKITQLEKTQLPSKSLLSKLGFLSGGGIWLALTVLGCMITNIVNRFINKRYIDKYLDKKFPWSSI